MKTATAIELSFYMNLRLINALLYAQIDIMLPVTQFASNATIYAPLALIINQILMNVLPVQTPLIIDI